MCIHIYTHIHIYIHIYTYIYIYIHIYTRMCQTEVKRTPFERLGNKYCSTNCVVAHKAVLGS